ncbi:hypothetical protein BD0049_03570 [Helicobacter pylori]
MHLLAPMKTLENAKEHGSNLWDKAQNLAKKEMDALDSHLLAFLNQQTHATH